MLKMQAGLRQEHARKQPMLKYNQTFCLLTFLMENDP
jgi:hypothetical protein